ncbi:hypothetical protein EDC18_10674 [Natranaerovirga pectinivora]|uniref:Uncharacterized protein n=1 Tax=Natranaerovirga pectinivora TaxID=682400 RepID=A0A4V2V064_9FIRM|nr:hypothetical protein [Natranaerovirga pectinivora]TCT14278.1 hypothetical protein EDC18_10674 [Natranaerovirga pectinivora]
MTKLLDAIKKFFQKLFNKSQIEEVTFDIDDENDRKRYIEAICDDISLAHKQIRIIKPELDEVQSILSDYQKLEKLPDNIKETLIGDVVELIKFREARETYKISLNIDPRLAHLEIYEDHMEEVLLKMNELEARQSLIKRDLEHLEGEKSELNYQRNKINKSRQMVKITSISFFCLFSLFLVIFTMLSSVYNKDVTIGSIGLLIISLIYVLFIYHFKRKSVLRLSKNDKLLKKALEYIKRVQIKYVNNTNLLEYEYKKYKVNTCNELRYLWDQYKKQKEEQEVYRQATNNLDILEDEILGKLKGIYIENHIKILTEIDLLVDESKKEEYMSNMTSLHTKLKEQMNFNKGILETSGNKLKILTKHNGVVQSEVEAILERKKEEHNIL